MGADGKRAISITTFKRKVANVGKRSTPAYITSLIRHFEDLRDGTHGGSTSREDKEAHFEKAVQLLVQLLARFSRK